MHTQPSPSILTGARAGFRHCSWRHVAPTLARVALASLAATVLAGCATRYQFQVDAIKDDAASHPRLSYRLVDARLERAAGKRDFGQLAGDVETALSARGMFLAPEGVAPDLMVEVDFGISPPTLRHGVRREPVYLELPGSSYASMAGRESSGSRVVQPQYVGEREVAFTVVEYRKFLRLTAREPDPDNRPGPGRQVWSVHITSQDASDDLMHDVRLMAAAAIDHIDTDSPEARRVVMTKRDRRVTFVTRGMHSS